MTDHDYIETKLHDAAAEVSVATTLPTEVRRRIRRTRLATMTTSFLVVAALVLSGGFAANAVLGESDKLRPAESSDENEDLTADVLIAKAPDGSWSMFAGVSEDGELLCLSLGLEGMGCVATTGRDSFILLQSFGHREQEGFVYGPVKPEVAALELVTDEEVIPLRLRKFPDRLGLDHLRFFVKVVTQGNGVIVARDKAGRVLQEMDVTWGRD